MVTIDLRDIDKNNEISILGKQREFVLVGSRDNIVFLKGGRIKKYLPYLR